MITFSFLGSEPVVFSFVSFVIHFDSFGWTELDAFFFHREVIIIDLDLFSHYLIPSSYVQSLLHTFTDGFPSWIYTLSTH